MPSLRAVELKVAEPPEIPRAMARADVRGARAVPPGILAARPPSGTDWPEDDRTVASVP